MSTTRLSLRGVTKSLGDRRLLDQVWFTVRPGERVGVVGENGAGKSTLLRMIVGRDRPDDGEIVLAASSVGFLAQTPELPLDRTVRDTIDAALAELRAMERQLRELEERLGEAAAERLTEYGELLAAFEMRGGYEADARVDKAMYGLGFAHVDRGRHLASLSGGELARLGLACVLAAAPEVMLLDEPTNHLDGAALTWLEDHMRGHGPKGAGKTTLLRVLARRARAGARRRAAPWPGRLPGPGDPGDPIAAQPARRVRRRAPRTGGGACGPVARARSVPAGLRVPVAALSAGQRRRLALARLVTTETDLLLLDEPTNHLSLALVEELEDALGVFTGALVVVSHDRRLRHRFTGAQREMRAGRLVA